MAALRGRGFGGERIHVHVWLSPLSCSPETITTLNTVNKLYRNTKFKNFLKIQNTKKKKKILNVGGPWRNVECQLAHSITTPNRK